FGRSGAGKSTLINLIAGLMRPDSGHITIEGRQLFDSQKKIDIAPDKRRIGYVFQEARLLPHLSVRRNLLYGYRRTPVSERKIHLDQVVSLLGLDFLMERATGTLSGGEKQRVALGRALLTTPRLLLMDEPLASLDQPRKDEIMPFIEKLRSDLALPIIYVSHAMPEIIRLADTMVLVSAGRVEAMGTVPELTSRIDLQPLTGRFEAGAVLHAQVKGHDPEFALTTLTFSGGRLFVPLVDLDIGLPVRLRIRARDVSLATKAPDHISISNQIGARIVEVQGDDGPYMDLRLQTGEDTLWARITRRAWSELGLAPGLEVIALIKAVAIDRQSLGPRPAKD
ncbi:MAG: molybdenum ABC transporter ATP-binding protein, partial [Pseudomonadota bacterium]